MSNKTCNLYIFAVLTFVSFVHVCFADRCGTVVTMGNNSLVDGFTITEASDYGVYGDGVDFTLENCIIEKNQGYGVFAQNGDVEIRWSEINENKRFGIFHSGVTHELIVENSWVLRNQQYGIFSFNSTLTLKNSIISESDLALQGHEGVFIYNPTYSPVIRNCTISNNKDAGVFFRNNNDPNMLPDIQNCIVYYNNNGGPQFAGSQPNDPVPFNPDTAAHYCCIQDCNEINNNFNDIPGFANTVDPDGRPDPRNYHLSFDSVCIDSNNLNSFPDEFDYDGETRLLGLSIDVGADEVDPDCNDISSEYDINLDGIVDMDEYNRFAQIWLSTMPSGEPNVFDVDEDYYIDFDDFPNFANEWLWTACWVDVDALVGLASAESTTALMSTSTASLLSTQSSSTETVQTTAEQIDSIQEILIFLDDLWKNEEVRQTVSEEQWDDFVDTLETTLYELESGL